MTSQMPKIISGIVDIKWYGNVYYINVYYINTHMVIIWLLYILFLFSVLICLFSFAATSCNHCSLCVHKIIPEVKKNP